MNARRVQVTVFRCAVVAAALLLLAPPVEGRGRRGGGGVEAADLVIHGGTIHTVDPKDTAVEALAVKGGLIEAVGKSRDLQVYIGPDTQAIDLKGKTVTP